jgi:hypothetical protein
MAASRTARRALRAIGASRRTQDRRASGFQNGLLPSGSRARGAALDDDPDGRYLVAGRQIVGGARGRRLRGGDLGLRSDENNGRQCRADSARASNAQPIDETEGNVAGGRSPDSGKIPTTDRDKAAERTIENQNAAPKGSASEGSVRNDATRRRAAQGPRNGGAVRCHAPCRCWCDRRDHEHGAQYHESSPCAHRKSPWIKSPRNRSLTSFAPWNLSRPGWHSSSVGRASPIRDHPKTRCMPDMYIFYLTINP